MEPTLADGAVVLTRPAGRSLRPRDLVVMRGADGTHYVKRLAAVPGDLVELEAGRLRVNGLSFDGRTPIAGASIERWKVPRGHYFVVGDNQSASSDSGTWEQPFVPASDVVGKVLLAFPGISRTANKGMT